MDNKINILLTSVGRRSYLVKYFKEALQGKGEVHVANSSDISPAFQVADYAIVTPLIYDKEYIPFLLKYCLENQISAIISLFDIDLPILAANKEAFKKIGTTVIVADKWVVDICNDKWKTFKFLAENGFNTPKTYISIAKALKDVGQAKLTYPLIVKPRWGMGSIAVYEADNEEELKIFYEKTKRNIQKTYLKYEAAGNIEESVIIQEKINGQEHGLDIINDLQGQYQNTVVKIKYAMRSGETDCAITTTNDSLKALGHSLSQKLKHIGNLDVDVFVVENRNYILEMNARFGGGYPFSHMAGVDLPSAIVQWLKGATVDSLTLQEDTDIMSQKDISMVRLHSNRDIAMMLCQNEAEIYNAVSSLERYLVPSYVERNINIQEYARKLKESGKVWILTNEKKEFVGIIAAYMNDMLSKTAYLTMLVIDKNYRRQHLAERLLRHAEAEAAKHEMVQFKLEVRKGNTSAIMFYKHQGYIILEDASEDSYYMIKNL